MSTIPAAGFFIASPRPKWPAAKAALDDMRDVLAEQPGGAAAQALTIASGLITPAEAASRLVVVDTEAAAASDDLDGIVSTNAFSGALLILRCASAARVVNVKNGVGASPLALAGSRDAVLDATSKAIVLECTGAGWRELGRFGWELFDEVAVKTADYSVPGTQNGETYSNAGAAGAVVLTLPTAVAGRRVRVVVMAAQTLTIQCAAGDKIRNEASESSVAGTAAAATVGHVIELLAIDATTWLAIAVKGTWTLA